MLRSKCVAPSKKKEKKGNAFTVKKKKKKKSICFTVKKKKRNKGYLPWMASVSPSPQELLPNKCKFRGIQYSILFYLDHDRQTCLSASSGLRRLNRGSCHTPKFARLIHIL